MMRSFLAMLVLASLAQCQEMVSIPDPTDGGTYLVPVNDVGLQNAVKAKIVAKQTGVHPIVATVESNCANGRCSAPVQYNSGVGTPRYLSQPTCANGTCGQVQGVRPQFSYPVYQQSSCQSGRCPNR